MPSLSALLKLDPFDARHTLVTSPFFSPSVLAAIRLAIASYTFATLIFSIVWGAVVQKNVAGCVCKSHLHFQGRGANTD
jgi:hypothetical protein